MTLVTVLILVAVLVPIVLLILAPDAPARTNPVPGRRRVAGHRRSRTTRLTEIPGQQGARHQAR
ncbi:hypothetical protein ACIRO3_26950 [Streptomyces sp. NPDC102278]|uniref:hypothetical protein n=1 Tax=Streptomyces sp. NPDC102278 TaxID=3366152 RepID=UPI0037F21645